MSDHDTFSKASPPASQVQDARAPTTTDNNDGLTPSDHAMLKRHPEIDTPAYRIELAEINAEYALQQAADSLAAQAWRERKRVKFTNLSFVGPAFRSRNRRSANKRSAWAVPVPKNTPDGVHEAAAEGARMACEFAQWCADSSISHYGHGLAEVMRGMAEVLANSTPEDKYLHEKRINGFCMMIEASLAFFLTNGAAQSDLSKAKNSAARYAEMGRYEAAAKNTVWQRMPLWSEPS